MGIAEQEQNQQQQGASPKNPYPDYWNIHGKYYDFSSYVDQHPGGRDWILLGKGRDCTELFQSVHCFAMEKPNAMLSKFEVAVSKDTLDSNGGGMFLWDKQDGFYATLCKRVKHYFEERNMSYKAPWYYYVKVILQLVMYMWCFVHAFTSGGSYWWIALAAIIGEQAHFCIMHDGSHAAISKHVTINLIGANMTYWFFFDYWIWLRHHIYGHHSFTGMYRKDPDLANSALFTRKHHNAKWKSHYSWQHWHTWLWHMFLPNQHFGQVIVYEMSDGNVFGLPLEKRPVLLRKRIIVGLSLFAHLIFPLFFVSMSKMLTMNLVYWTLVGISYFLLVLPNHDTDDVLKSMLTPSHDRKLDWGEMQVRNSCNHSITNSFWHKLVTELYGGMNYQIEHHLFPSMNHCHYAAIAPIVQQTCQEFAIPYNAKSNWFAACLGYYHMQKTLSNNKME